MPDDPITPIMLLVGTAFVSALLSLLLCGFGTKPGLLFRQPEDD